MSVWYDFGMQIKLLQWNILYKERIKDIAKTIKKLNPDIVCLQELGINCKFNPTIPNTAKYIKDQLGYNSYFEEAQRWKDDEELDAIGNGIFTRFPITSTFSKQVQNQTGKFVDYSSEGRVYVETTIKIGDTDLTVGTTHLSYVHKFGITEEKKTEVDNLVKIVLGKEKNYILTGDFNSIPDSYTIKELSKYLKNCGPNLDQNTWANKPFDYNGFKEDKIAWRLDYVFASKDVNCISAEIIQTEFSDHLPILVSLNI